MVQLPHLNPLSPILITAPSANSKIQRSYQAIAQFKHEHPCPATGRRTGACKGWTIDHVIPLACGGEDSPGNMQWQTAEEAKAKDKWERKGCTISKGSNQ